MEFYQLKIIRKGTKPPVWRRCLVPSDITFAQMAVILEEILEYTFTDKYEFEFYQEKVQVREYKEGEPKVDSSQYGSASASDTLVNSLLDNMTWFTFRVKDKEQEMPEYRAEVEKKLPVETGENVVHCPCIIKEKTGTEDAFWSETEKINKRLEELFSLEKKTSSRSRNPKIAEYLQAYDEEDLAFLAGEIGIADAEELKNPELAARFAEEVLKPEVMEKEILRLNEREFRAFEKVTKKGLFYVEENEWTDLEWASDIGYLAVYDDGYAEVPAEVSAVFNKICTPEFCELQKKRSWLTACLVMVECLYGTAPARVVYRMYRRRKECRVSFDEFTELFRSVPEEENLCVLDGDRISLRGLLEEKEIYQMLLERQGNREFYIPSEEEIADCVYHGYPSRTPVYRRILSLLTEELGMDTELAEAYLCEIYRVYYTGGLMSEAMEQLNKNGVIFETQKQAREMAELLMEAYNTTRKVELCGHTLDEEGIGNRRNETIFPGMFQNNMPVSSNKKIYPNDPCPCGSGKKYKKCCGRNVK